MISAERLGKRGLARFAQQLLNHGHGIASRHRGPQKLRGSRHHHGSALGHQLLRLLSAACQSGPLLCRYAVYLQRVQPQSNQAQGIKSRNVALVLLTSVVPQMMQAGFERSLAAVKERWQLCSSHRGELPPVPVKACSAHVRAIV